MHRPSQLAQAVALSRVSRPVLSTLSRQSSRRNERRLARRTISAYLVCIHVSSFLFLVLIESPPFARLVPSDNCHLYYIFDGLRLAQGPSATSYCTTVFGAYTADSGRPSSVISRRGPSTLPCMTGSRPSSANRLWASTRRPQRLNGSILRRPRRVISPSSASTRGHFTSYRPCQPAQPARSAPIRYGSSKRASWYVSLV